MPVIFARLITRPGDANAVQREWKMRRGVARDPLPCRGRHARRRIRRRQSRLPGEAVFSKSRYNAFAGTGLDAHLRDIGRDTLVIAGLTTECCVDSTARSAFERDYHVFIASDAVAAYDKDLHDAALKTLELNCAMLAGSADIIAAWKNL